MKPPVNIWHFFTRKKSRENFKLPGAVLLRTALTLSPTFHQHHKMMQTLETRRVKCARNSTCNCTYQHRSLILCPSIPLLFSLPLFVSLCFPSVFGLLQDNVSPRWVRKDEHMSIWSSAPVLFPLRPSLHHFLHLLTSIHPSILPFVSLVLLVVPNKVITKS